jgi:thiamine biosynthesis protein ThiI
VASQTIKALGVTDSAVDMPILRPCIAMDKQDIVDLAQKIGTLETSTLPYEDCCTLFVPRHPDTKPALHDVQASESLLDAEKMICEALENSETLNISVD